MRNDYMLIDEVMRRQVEEMMTWLAIRIDGLGLGLGLGLILMMNDLILTDEVMRWWADEMMMIVMPMMNRLSCDDEK